MQSRALKSGLRCGGIALLLVSACRHEVSVPAGYQGLVEYDEHVVSFEVPGRVERVEVHRGDRVTAAQALARLDDTIERLTTEARRQDANAAQADLALLEAGSRKEDVASLADDLRAAASNEDLMRTNAERTRKLFADGSLPKSDLDKAEADLERSTFDRKSLERRLAALRQGARPQEIARALARSDQSRAQLALEEELLARHTLRARDPGEVIDIATKAGELAALGTPAMTVADTTHPYVEPEFGRPPERRTEDQIGDEDGRRQRRAGERNDRESRRGEGHPRLSRRAPGTCTRGTASMSCKTTATGRLRRRLVDGLGPVQWPSLTGDVLVLAAKKPWASTGKLRASPLDRAG
jgi:multidrug efflux pump subunit AcrA (membrane-fusion protein)